MSLKATRYCLNYFWGLVKQRRIKFLPAVMVGIIASAVGLITPWFSKIFIDEILVNQNVNYTVPLLLFWLFFDLTRSVGFGLRSLYSSDSTSYLTVDISVAVLKKIHRCSSLIFKDYSPGVFITHVNEMENNACTLFDLIDEVVEITIYLLAMPLAFIVIDPVLALIVGATVVLCVVTSIILSRVIDKLHLKKREEEGSFAQKNISIMEHMPEIRSYSVINDVMGELDCQCHIIRELGLKKTFATTTNKVVNRSTFAVGSFFYRFIAVYLVYDGKMTIGDYFAYNALLSLLFSPLELLTSLVGPIQEMIVNSVRMKKLLLFPEQHSGNTPIPASGDLAVRLVSFRFGVNDRDVIKNFDYEFKRGVLYGIVGRNGAGKSTLLKLMARQYDADRGRIEYGAVPIDEIDRDIYCSSTAYIPTSGYVFPSSFNKNIILNSELDKVRLDEIVEILNIGHLRDKFGSCEVGFLSNNDVYLSSGENQKIVLARAIYSRHKIYLFDEAFSFLDEISQSNVLRFIKKHMNESIVIMVTHDLNTIRHTDHVICMDSGMVVETGDYASLVRKHSMFSYVFGGAKRKSA